MDTTETYIKMCEKSEEIQEIWRQSPNKCIDDVMINAVTFNMCKGREGLLSSKVFLFGQSNFPNDPFIWLPRQDQLQGMVDQHIYGSPWWILGQFKDFYQGKRWIDGCLTMEPEFMSYVNQFASMEQLWLAFIKHELYQKRWNGEEWIK